MRPHFLFTQLALLPSVALAQTCYSPLGLEVTNDEVVPCTVDPVTTICCHSNRTRGPGMSHEGGNTADECLPNGICQNRFTYEGKPEATYWVEYCTDKDYESGNCMDICHDKRGEAGTAMITPCDGTNNSEKWCCGESDACCYNPNSNSITFPQKFVGMINGTVASLATASTIPAPTRSSDSAPKSNTTANPTSDPSPSQSPPASAQAASTELSTGAKAGIGIGATLGALALIGVGFFARNAMAWKKDAQRLKEAEVGTRPYAEIYSHKYQHAGFAPSELPRSPPAELAVSPAELGDHPDSKTPAAAAKFQ